MNTAGRVVGSLATPSVEKTDTTGRADMAVALGIQGKALAFPGKTDPRSRGEPYTKPPSRGVLSVTLGLFQFSYPILFGADA